MALTHEQKDKMVREYSEKVGRAQVMIWSRYTRLTVPKVQALRRSLRANEAEAVVVKNTLMGIALKQADMPVDHGIMSGMSIVTFAYGDVAAATRAVFDFARTNGEDFQVIGGVVGGRLANAEQVRSLVDLPSREVLLGRVVGGIQAPISGFVGVLAAVMRGFMTVLNARAEQLGGTEASA